MNSVLSAGFLARRRKIKRDAERIIIEDALKVMYDFEDRKLKCSVNNLAAALSVNGDKLKKTINTLKVTGLITITGDGILLTGEGRSYALRIIRIHRLLEKYYSEKTGIEQKLWHKEAETQEHFLTEVDADKLSASMGNPLFDPHGDPIPAADGIIHSLETKPLTSVQPGEIVKIIHVEDEPVAVYAQLTALRLYPGLVVKLAECSKERIIIIAHGEEIILAPLIAENISVAELPAEEKIITKFKTLDSINQGETAVVAGISNECRGQQRRRLMDLGIVPGSKVTAELVSTWANPVAYKVRGALIALRKEHAEMIFIKDVVREVENDRSK